jgi:alkylated DNA repair dioxygenase AlkB
MTYQTDLFAGASHLPPGFRYQPDLITAEQERDLLTNIRTLPFKEFEFHGFVGNIRTLPFKEFEFHGFVGKRRTVSFGWKYDFSQRSLLKANDIPSFLLDVRAIAAQFAGMNAEHFQHALVIEYGPGAAIGWHRDKAVFGEVIGISLLAPCTFRLRRPAGTKWERFSLTAEPRSAYLLSGPSRTEWEHSIPPVDALRYSITFRNLRSDGTGNAPVEDEP